MAEPRSESADATSSGSSARSPIGTPRRPEPTRRSIDWKAVGLRKTPQREIVFGLLQSAVDHPTADWIHQEARQILPSISLATIYRTLRTLKEKGLVHEFSGGSVPSRYDGAGRGHEHIRCVRCGAVENVILPELGDIRDRVAERTEFRVGNYPLLFYGLCEMCGQAEEESADRPHRARPAPGEHH